MAYLLHILILINIYIIVALSLNLIAGYAGILSISHAAFYGVGAYAETHRRDFSTVSDLIVEQKVRQVLEIADRVYVLKLGQVSDKGRAEEFKNTERLHKAFL